MTIPADIRERAEAMVNQAGPGGDDRPTLVANIIALVVEQCELGETPRRQAENAAKGLYPDDILRAAESVFLREISPEKCRDTGGVFMLGRIAHVLMAERERMKANLDRAHQEFKAQWLDLRHDDATRRAYMFAATLIASAIRNEGEQKT